MCGLFIEQKSALVGKCFSVKLEKPGSDPIRKTGQSLVRLYIAHNGLLVAYFAYIEGGGWFDLPGVLYDSPKVPY